MSADEPPRDPAADDRPKSGARERRLIAWVTTLALVAVPLIAAGALFNKGAIFGRDSGIKGRVSLAEEVVRNSRYDSDDVGLHGAQTRESSPTVDLTLLNSTSEPVLVTSATVTVLASQSIPQCYAQGAGDVPGNAPETINLPPADDRAGRKLTRDLHHFVPAHGLERFMFRFATSRLPSEEYSLYELGLKLTTSAGQTLDGRKVVVAAPASVPRDGQYLPEDDAILEQAQGGPHLDSTWCFRRNIATVRRAVSWPGKRAPETRTLASFATARRWPAFQERLPARRAARKLASSGVLHVQDAVFAAEATHDAEFEQLIKRRCAQLLLKDAGAKLRSRFPQGALESATRARGLSNSAAARRLVIDSERRLESQRLP